MKKITGFKLVLLGIILYTPYFLCSLKIEEMPRWVFWISAVPAGLCILIGLFQSRAKRDPEFDDTMKNTMRDRKYLGREENR